MNITIEIQDFPDASRPYTASILNPYSGRSTIAVDPDGAPVGFPSGKAALTWASDRAEAIQKLGPLADVEEEAESLLRSRSTSAALTLRLWRALSSIDPDGDYDWLIGPRSMQQSVRARLRKEGLDLLREHLEELG